MNITEAIRDSGCPDITIGCSVCTSDWQRLFQDAHTELVVVSNMNTVVVCRRHPRIISFKQDRLHIVVMIQSICAVCFG